MYNLPEHKFSSAFIFNNSLYDMYVSSFSVMLNC